MTGFIDSFDGTATLAVTSCSRCTHEGLVEVDWETYREATSHDRHEPKATIDPSIYGQCPACRMVVEWPSCTVPRGGLMGDRGGTGGNVRSGCIEGALGLFALKSPTVSVTAD